MRGEIGRWMDRQTDDYTAIHRQTNGQIMGRYNEQIGVERVKQINIDRQTDRH